MGLLERAMEGGRLRTSHAQVVGHLGRDIVSGVLPEGSILPGDSDLSARFGVSRTVLREAMKTLAAKQLVEPKAKVGTRVLDRSAWNLFDADVLSWRFETGVDAAFVADLAEIRMALEPAAAGLAARRATTEEILRLYEIAGRMNDLAHTPQSIAKVDLEFHHAVLKAAKNPFMSSIGSLIEAALAISFTLSSPVTNPGQIDELARNHLRIAQAIAARDEDKAQAAMRAVIATGADRASGALARQGEEA